MARTINHASREELPTMRNASIDVLKVSLALMVVALHCYIFREFSKAGSYYLYNGFLRVAVPMFFILNGYFMPRTGSVKDNVLWFQRVLLLYLFWMAVYSPLYVPQASNYAFPFNLAYLAGEIVFGHWHLWYLSALIMAGAIVIGIRERGSKFALGLALLLYVTGCAIQYIAHYAYNGALSYALYRNVLFFGLPFVIIGYHYEAISGYVERHANAILALGLGLMFIEISFAWFHAENRRGFDMYAGLLLVCPAFFAKVRQARPFQTTWPLGKISSALYLLHPGCMVIGSKLGIPDGTRMFLFALTLSLALTLPVLYLSRRKRFGFVL
jgi:surface polysaccharide O-acyltransferase-like enzyme